VEVSTTLISTLSHSTEVNQKQNFKMGDLGGPVNAVPYYQAANTRFFGVLPELA